MRKYNIILIITTIVVMFNSTIFAHDNAKVHPFTLTGKAIELLVPLENPTPEQLKYKELQDYFNYQMPTEYWNNTKDTNGNGKIDLETEANINALKIGTFGTIAEDKEDYEFNDTDGFSSEVFHYSMFNHFYYAPKHTALFEYRDPFKYALMTADFYIKENGYQSIRPRNPIKYSILEGLKTSEPSLYEQLKTKDDSLITDNLTNLWASSMKLYHAGRSGNNDKDINHAYFQLGRILHMVQDMTSVPHKKTRHKGAEAQRHKVTKAQSSKVKRKKILTQCLCASGTL